MEETHKYLILFQQIRSCFILRVQFLMRLFILKWCFTDCSLNCYWKAGGRRDHFRRKRHWKSHTSESYGNSTLSIFSLPIIFISLPQSALSGDRTVNRGAIPQIIFLSHHACKSPKLSPWNPHTHFWKHQLEWSICHPEISPFSQ